MRGGPAGGLRSLYLHIPFCERRCGYCDFTAVAGLTGQREYAAALRAELERLGRLLPGVELDTVFVGGGTPGLLDPPLLRGIMDQVRDSFELSADAEVTLEANPSSTSVERAESWLVAGFNRVSLGVQALEPAILEFLGRVHDADRALAAVGEVRRAGFRRVNCDLIYAVPGLDDDAWRATLDRVLELDPGHLSCYELTVERGTPLHLAVARGRAPAVDEASALRQHRLALRRLGVAGYRQYEVSNFARPGEECRHNLACWRGEHYLAAGVGAHAHLPAWAAEALGLPLAPGALAVRCWHTRSLPAYVAQATAGGLALAGSEPIDQGARRLERLMLGLRLSEGVRMVTGRRLGALAEAGLVQLSGGAVSTTARGQEVLDRVTAELAEGLAL